MSKQSATVLYGGNDIHLVIGAKGGIGKTYVASDLYLTASHIAILRFTDVES